ncbi:MAG: hypothetical protein WCA34_17235, partial [Candidatus Acidiferrales bacterium]
MNRCFVLMICFVFPILFLPSSPAFAQSQKAAGSYLALPHRLEELVNTPAVSGYENHLADKIRASLGDLHPVTDNL